MLPHRKLILLCARTVLPADIREQIFALLKRNLDWDRLVHEAHREGLAPLVSQNLKNFQAQIPKTTVDRLKTIYYNNLSRNLFFAEELTLLNELLADNDIPMIPIKGVLLAET